MARRRGGITRLEDHPNLGEILGVLARLPHIDDADLEPLAGAWENSVAVAEARARALTPDTPLVCEALAAFDAVEALFAEDLRGERPYVVVPPATTSRALKAVRDAIAAAFARPALSRAEHALLLRPWRRVYGDRPLDEPDLGPRAAEVKALLALLPTLAGRCHDRGAAVLYERLRLAAAGMDADLRDLARRETWDAAVITSRRRLWALVHRSAAEGLSRRCPTCAPAGDDDVASVLTVCVDAACALLVADAVDDTLTEILTLPVTDLVPLPRTAAES